MVTAAGTSVAATWTWTYDLAGRVTSQADPDTGASSSTYDDTGDLTSTTNAQSKTVAYTYDALGRQIGSYQNSPTGTHLGGWVYDTLQAGQLTSTTRYTSAGNYTVAATGYDAYGNPTGTTTSVPASLTGFGSSYTTSYFWTRTHLMAGETPADGGSLPTETIDYTYDALGDPVTSTGATTYVSNAAYSAYGEPAQYSLETDAQSAWLTYRYDDQTRRLSNVLFSAQSVTSQLENVAYTYDPAGNTTKGVDTQGGGTGAPVESNCYRYDTLDQLSEAWSATDNCAQDPATNGNATIVGPQPYWQSLDF